MKCGVLLLLVVSFYFASAERVVLESTYDASFLPSGFSALKEAPKEREISLHFAVKQQNLELLQTLFDSVSDPQSKAYGLFFIIAELVCN